MRDHSNTSLYSYIPLYSINGTLRALQSLGTQLENSNKEETVICTCNGQVVLSARFKSSGHGYVWLSGAVDTSGCGCIGYSMKWMWGQRRRIHLEIQCPPAVPLTLGGRMISSKTLSLLPFSSLSFSTSGSRLLISLQLYSTLSRPVPKGTCSA